MLLPTLPLPLPLPRAVPLTLLLPCPIVGCCSSNPLQVSVAVIGYMTKDVSTQGLMSVPAVLGQIIQVRGGPEGGLTAPE